MSGDGPRIVGGSGRNVPSGRAASYLRPDLARLRLLVHRQGKGLGARSRHQLSAHRGSQPELQPSDRGPGRRGVLHDRIHADRRREWDAAEARCLRQSLLRHRQDHRGAQDRRRRRPQRQGRRRSRRRAGANLYGHVAREERRRLPVGDLQEPDRRRRLGCHGGRHRVGRGILGALRHDAALIAAGLEGSGRFQRIPIGPSRR